MLQFSIKKNMIFLIFLFIQSQFLFKNVETSHFDGGFMTAYPLDSNDTYTTFVLYTRFAYSRTSSALSLFCDQATIQSKVVYGYTFPLACITGCVTSGATTLIRCIAYSIQNDWTMVIHATIFSNTYTLIFF